MDVQRENREETVINQDATILMNGIRDGARGMDDLVRYVIAITNSVSRYDSAGKQIGLTITNWFTPNNSSFGPGSALTNGFRIVGLLTTPKYIPSGKILIVNNIVAAFRSMSGPASEKFPQTDASMQDLAFSYRMISEVQPYGWNSPVSATLQNNLHEVRLIFRWPWGKGPKAPGRQVYRALVGGSIIQTNAPGFTPTLFFFEPQTYVKAP